MAAVKCAENREAALISEDTDLLVLLCYHANLENNRIFFSNQSQSKDFRQRPDLVVCYHSSILKLAVTLHLVSME